MIGFYARDIPIFFDDALLVKIQAIMATAVEKGHNDFAFYEGESFNFVMRENCPGTRHVVNIDYKPKGVAAIYENKTLSWFADFCDYIVLVQPTKPHFKKGRIFWLNSTTLEGTWLRPN